MPNHVGRRHTYALGRFRAFPGRANRIQQLRLLPNASQTSTLQRTQVEFSGMATLANSVFPRAPHSCHIQDVARPGLQRAAACDDFHHQEGSRVLPGLLMCPVVACRTGVIATE